MLHRSSDPHPWAEVTAPSRHVELVFDAPLSDEDDPVANLSAGVAVGDCLFLGSDEGSALERLHWDGARWADHRRLALGDWLELASADEADIEGLATDDGWLWVLGSHARTRPSIKKGKADRICADALCDLRDTRPRCLLARLPLAPDPGLPGAVVPVRRDGARRAGMLRQTKHGNALAAALAKDPLIKPFTRIAAKEGGVDLEGIAAAGRRIALGMRGPVIRSFAVLLEVEIGAKPSGRLKLAGPPCKRLLDLEGLGIRDLKRAGEDLLILAGPTTGLDGPCAIDRWRCWLQDLPTADGVIRLHRPERIIDLPFGRGNDHPEGLALLPSESGNELLVVNDGPAPTRLDAARRTLTCDVFALPD